jgi:hypothetical protein
VREAQLHCPRCWCTALEVHAPLRCASARVAARCPGWHQSTFGDDTNDSITCGIRSSWL